MFVQLYSSTVCNGFVLFETRLLVWNACGYLCPPRHAHCLIHDQDCSILPRVGMIHFAGTPCTAVSSMGLRDFDSAMSFAHFLTWIGLRRTCQEPVIVQVDRDLLQTMLPMYDWSYAIISPCQLGWPVRRIRQWCVCPGVMSKVAALLFMPSPFCLLGVG